MSAQPDPSSEWWTTSDVAAYLMHRDKIIADAMGKRAMSELKRSGTQRARGKKK